MFILGTILGALTASTTTRGQAEFLLPLIPEKGWGKKEEEEEEEEERRRWEREEVRLGS